MLNPYRASVAVAASASMLVNGSSPPPFQSVTMYANTNVNASGNASVDADALRYTHVTCICDYNLVALHETLYFVPIFAIRMFYRFGKVE